MTGGVSSVAGAGGAAVAVLLRGFGEVMFQPDARAGWPNRCWRWPGWSGLWSRPGLPALGDEVGTGIHCFNSVLAGVAVPLFPGPAPGLRPWGWTSSRSDF